MTSSSALPRAVISRSALTAAAAAAVAAGGSIADLRRDAWGHGILSVAHVALAAGAEAVLVDSSDEVDALGAEGITATADAEADIDSRILYGLPDADGQLSTAPVLRLVGRVLSTKRLLAGEAVSYGYTHRATTDTTVALVSGGYAQGIVRALGNQVHVAAAGRPGRMGRRGRRPGGPVWAGRRGGDLFRGIRIRRACLGTMGRSDRVHRR